MRKARELKLTPWCRRAEYLFAILLLVVALAPAALSQSSAGPSQPLITQAINEASLVALLGNTRPEARDVANDRGRVSDSMPMEHMLLQLRRPAAQELALATLIDQLHDPNSPSFHHWLSAAELGAQFGPAASDIQAVTGWLAGHGFTVNTLYPNRMVIDYSGTAGQVRTTFHTEIHNLSVNGVAHIANMTDPQIPAALAPAVVGIVSLHDFLPRPAAVHNPHSSVAPGANLTTSGGNYYVTPQDLDTIYNFNPVFTGGNTGQGQTIYLIENSDLYATSDWSTFRSAFGIPLSSYPGASLTTIHPAPPSGPNNCNDPGANGDDAEATLDAEYASGAAPSAAIVMATCTSTSTGGWTIAIENLLNGASPPAIVNMSYIDCEENMGASANAALSLAYQTGVAAGSSIFVSAGDEGPGACDYGGPAVTHGITVNALASTPYNVAVGGTDYSDTYSGTNSTYWNSSNTTSFGSAKSYIPEIPWNSTCGSQLSATSNGFAATYGTSGFCNSTKAGTLNYQSDWAGSGGPSGCATGTPAVSEVDGGSCAGYPKPSWQNGFLGNPADGVRDLPDVSLFASFGPWKHGYVICFSDTSNGGVSPCTTSASGWSYDWGGTSFAAPIWAGIQALINENSGTRQGNPNYRLYQLAAKEYGTSGSSTCNSSNGNTVSASCIFYDVTLGDMDTPCRADSSTLYNCYLPSGTYGVVSTSNASYAPAFQTTTGWDFATGIGTVNVANLVNGWLSGGVPLTDAHDFNGDGHSDIFWRDTSGNMSIWEMNGGTILNPSNSGLGGVPTTWSIVGQRDFNGDGKADILWRDTSGNLSIWEMNGTTILNPSNSGLGSVPTTWSIVGTGDFNGDGYADILWRDTAGDLSIWEMNGTTILNPSNSGLGTVATNWSVVGVGDFNGDGMADILWRNNTNGNVAIWLMNGTTVTNSSTTSVGNMPLTWSVAGTGDFNGDGNSDILWTDTSGDIAIWEMNGTTILNPSATGVGSLSTVWTVAETGDFNGDGKSDILWRDTSGDIAIWYMNGTTISSGTGLGTIPTTFTIQGTNAD